MSRIEISQIRRDGDTQIRAKMNEAAIDDFAEALKAGDALPPVTLFFDRSDYWLADGFHRVAAAEMVGLDSVDADVREGGQREALLYAVGANADHGLRRTNEDKRRAVRKLLGDPEWGRWPASKMARVCRVSDRFVQRLKRESSTNSSEMPTTVVVERNGKTYEMNTANIGKGRKPHREETMEDDSAAEPTPPSKPRRLKAAMGKTIARQAISNMKQIKRSDTERAEGFQMMREFMESRRDW